MQHLKILMEKRQVSQTDLAKVLRRDKSAITNLLQGKRRLKADEVVRIAEYLGVSEMEVLGKEPSGFEESARIPFQSAPSEKVAASTQVVQEGDRFFLEDAGSVSPKTYALEVRDDSLNLAGFLKGDIVISELDRPVKPGDFVVVQHYEGDGAETIIRHYLPPYLLPHSSDLRYEKLHESRASVRIVSPVLRLIRLF